jgi:hypothetical protein
VYGRSDGIGERVEGVVRSMSVDREGRQRMIHGGGHLDRWGEDEETISPSGERLMWKGTGCVVGDERMVERRESHADRRGGVNGRHAAAGERRREE